MPAGTSRKISAASARAHTRKSKPKSFAFLPSGLFKKFLLVFFVGLFAWVYQAARPPPPKPCGSPNGPPVTAPRITLSDGRHLAYKELGVSKDEAKYRIIAIHGFDSCRHDVNFLTTSLSPDTIKSLGIYIVSFDRPGYGESDPNPDRTLKSMASDVEELADQLGLGSKFYVIGFSMGGQSVWPCLKYIPHRLAGAALIAPAVNYWWPSLPANLSKEVYNGLLLQDQWALRVAHYTPWLTYWWNTQKLFPPLAVIAQSPAILSRQDLEIVTSTRPPRDFAAQVRQQGEFESIHRDLNIGFGKWEFDPVEVENPFPNNEGSVHIWQGDEDKLVPVSLQQFIAEKLSWIRYHEFAGAGHFLPYAEGMADKIVRALVTGSERWLSGLQEDIGSLRQGPTRNASKKSFLPSGVFKKSLFVFLIGILAWVYQATRPPPPKTCGSPKGPPVTAPRIRLSEGRHLAYKELGVTKDRAKYKIVFVHGFDSCRHDADAITATLSPDTVENLGICIVSFDRPGYGESDPNPNRTLKSMASDVEELADQLGLGSKFYVIGFSMGGQAVWPCLKYIPHRLAGAALIAPVVNYWWRNLPANLSKEAFNGQLLQDQWALRVAHYTPGLTYWWNTQKMFPPLALLAQSPAVLLCQDLEIAMSSRSPREFKVRQQGEFESIYRDLIIGFGSWGFDPVELENPFPENEGSVHVWQGDEDKLVPVSLQPLIAAKQPWIRYHELAGAERMGEKIDRTLLVG